MRNLLAWMIVAGLLAGLVGRAMPHPAESCMTPACERSLDCPEAGSPGDGNSGTGFAGHSEDPAPAGPEHHHHHHLCGGVVAMIADTRAEARLLKVDGLRTGLNPEQLAVPESPVFELDKPPLI